MTNGIYPVKWKFWILFSNSFAHMFIDFVCAATIFQLAYVWNVDNIIFIYLVILYNCLAFGLQTVIWLLLDKYQTTVLYTIIGCFLVIAWSGITNIFPLIWILCLWIWNAFFHIWWWISCMATNPWKADVCWIFVAPWALWLLFGTLLWKSWMFDRKIWLIFGLLIIAWIYFSSRKFLPYKLIQQFSNGYMNKKLNWRISVVIIILLLLLSIVIRSFIWFLVTYSRKVWELLIIFTLSIVGGKALWWVLADKIGWMKVWISSLVLSIPCLLLGENMVVLWIVWIFLFNITMSIALAALVYVFPRRRWFAFWLLCLALLVWSLPFLLWMNFSDNRNIILTILILISVWSLFTALSSINIDK